MLDAVCKFQSPQEGMTQSPAALKDLNIFHIRASKDLSLACFSDVDIVSNYHIPEKSLNPKCDKSGGGL